MVRKGMLYLSVCCGFTWVMCGAAEGMKDMRKIISPSESLQFGLAVNAISYNFLTTEEYEEEMRCIADYIATYVESGRDKYDLLGAYYNLFTYCWDTLLPLAKQGNSTIEKALRIIVDNLDGVLNSSVSRQEAKKISCFGTYSRTYPLNEGDIDTIKQILHYRFVENRSQLD